MFQCQTPIGPNAALPVWCHPVPNGDDVFRDLFKSNYFSCEETNRPGVCKLFPNHPFQIRGKSRFSIQSSLYHTPLLVLHLLMCPHLAGVWDGLQHNLRDKSAQKEQRATLWEQRGSRDSNPPTASPNCHPWVQCHSIPAMSLPQRVLLSLCPGSLGGKFSVLQFNQTVWWELSSLITWKVSSSERKEEREREKLNWSVNQSRA